MFVPPDTDRGRWRRRCSHRCHHSSAHHNSLRITRINQVVKTILQYVTIFFFKNWSLFLSSFKLSPYWNYAFFKWKWNRGLPFAAVKAVQSRAHYPCNTSKLHTFKKDRNRTIKFNFELNLLSWLQRKVRLLWKLQPGQTDRRTDGLTDSWWYVHGQYTELPTCSIRLSCRIIHCYSGRCLSRHVYCQIFVIIQMNNESLVIGLFSHECQVLQNSKKKNKKKPYRTMLCKFIHGKWNARILPKLYNRVQYQTSFIMYYTKYFPLQ